MSAARDRVAEALEAHDRGWALTPLAGKIPTMKDWPKAPPPTREQVEAWARQGNVGLRTGTVSGVFVVDRDPGGVIEPEPATVTVETGRDGRHYYFTSPAPCPGNSAGKLGLHIDTRGDGGQVVFVGSVHPDTGKPYRWAAGRSPRELPLAALPPSMLSRLTTPSGARNGGDRLDLASILAGVPEGQRDSAIFRGACKLRAAGVPEDVAVALMTEAAKNAVPPFPLDRALEKVHRAFRIYEGEALHLTDCGNADRLVRDHGERIRYVHELGRWHLWTGSHWAEERAGQMAQLARQTVVGILNEAAALQDDKDKDQRKAIASHALRSEANKKLDAMLTVARSDATVALVPEDLDRDPWLLNVKNGTLDLRTCELREHRPGDLVTYCLPVTYDMGETCPRWEAFLDRVLGGDQELIYFVQRAIGYSLTGSTREQCLFLLYGTGKNGKSTFLEVLGALLGPLGRVADFGTFLVKRGDAIPNDVARLRGARLVTAIEAEGERRLAEGAVKRMTGGDTISARFLKQEWFEYKPAFKVWLAANHRPVIRGTDLAIWRRVRLVPFTVTIPEEERDPDLGDKLREELPGILTWAVVGCYLWGQKGLGTSEAVTKATGQYREDMDILGGFLTDRCVLGPKEWTESKRLYKAYREWAEAEGEQVLGGRAFANRLKDRAEGITPKATTAARGWQGIDLR